VPSDTQTMDLNMQTHVGKLIMCGCTQTNATRPMMTMTALFLLSHRQRPWHSVLY